MTLLDNGAVRRALRFAERKHRGEPRKGTEDVPYFTHPVAVAILLASVGAPVAVIVAGILHDVVEDTSATIEEVRAEFGDQVAAIVEQLTKPKGEFSATQTAQRLEALEAVAGKAGDLVVNLGDLLDDADEHGPEHLALLFRDPLAKLDSYLELASLLKPRLRGQGDPLYAAILSYHLAKVVRRAEELRSRLAG